MHALLQQRHETLCVQYGIPNKQPMIAYLVEIAAFTANIGDWKLQYFR